MNTLTIVRGIPGAGKTTFANTLNAVLVEADQFFTDKDGKYRFNPSQIKEAHIWCQLEVKRLLQAGYDVVVANTFVKVWELSFYTSLANHLNITFEVVQLNGRFQNSHGVPLHKVESMAKQFEPFEPSVQM